MEDKLELVASLHVKVDQEIYKVVDWLNKHLKEKNVIFGLAKDHDSMVIKIYET